MKNKFNLVLLSTILGVGTSALPNAHAQESESDATLEEIVVTAQKRTQNLSDVAASISVVTGTHLDEYNILTFQDLERISAGLTLTQANPRNVTISLRGVTVDPESGTAAGVDVYQNNVTQRGDNIFGAIYDMERVEVLRGAQGSVQGATSPAGAIVLHTKRADLDEFRGYAQGTYGEGNKGLNLQAALSVPIIKDQLAFRIAVYNDNNDANNITNITTGNVQDRKSTSFRGSLRWKPTENLDINLVHQKNDEEILGTPAVEGTRSGANAFAAGSPGVPCVALARVPNLSCVSLTPKDNTALAANDAFSNREADVTTLNLDWTLGRHQLSYVFGKTESTKTSRTENDVSNNLPLQNFFYQSALQVMTDTTYRTHQGTTTQVDADVHELRFASVDNESWNYMAGIYYQDQKTTTRFDAWVTSARYIPLRTLNGPRTPINFTGGHIEGINFSTGGVIPFNAKTTAVFTAHSFQFNEKATVEAAVRYQKIEQLRISDILYGQISQMDKISVQGATATTKDASATMLPDTQAAATATAFITGTIGGISSAFPLIGVPPAYQSAKPDAITGSVGFKYDFSDNFKSYVSWNRAFRAGGISITPGEALAVNNLLFNDETSDSIEIGAKMVFLDGKAEVNVAVFHQIFDGFLGYVTDLTYVRTPIVDAALADQPAAEALAGGLVYNADATFSGVELDWRVLFGSNYQMGGSVNYIKAAFDNASVPCNIRTGDEQLGRCTSSARVPGSPEISANLFAEYTLPIGAMNFFVRGNAKYNGGIVATRAVLDQAKGPGETNSFVLVDVFVGVNHNNWEVSVWAKNLLGDDSLLDLTNPGDNFDVNNDFREVRRQQERGFGLTGRFNFN